jgi:hypothetical protein
MTNTYLAGASQSTVVRSAAALVLPICAWAAFGLWRGYSVPIVLGVSVALRGLSLWAISARGVWKQITVTPDTIALQREGIPEVVIRRHGLLKLELRDKLFVIKWRATPKDRVELLARERFSSSTWHSLCESLNS